MSKAIDTAAKALARLGGLGRAAKLTPQQRSDSARAAVRARWARVKGGQVATVPAKTKKSSGRQRAR